MAKLDFLNLKPFDEKRQRGPAAPKQEKKTKRLSRRKPERRKDDDEYNRLSELYKQQNGKCVYCGKAFDPEQLQNDHIVSGTHGRGASLLHFDTWNTTCDECHEKQTRSEKAAAKVVHVLRTIERLQGRNFKTEECELILKAIEEREPGHAK